MKRIKSGDVKRRVPVYMGSVATLAFGIAAVLPATAPAFAAATGVTAASQAEGQDDITEVLVTARKRKESIIDVPDAITAFSAKQVAEAGLVTLRDFSNMTPNINVTTGSGAAYPVIIVRGLAQAQGGEEPVAFVIDGVQIASPAFISQDYGDIEQVQVLRGPQGSLYGRNAIGGAIIITTRAPTNELEGKVKASYGNANAVNVNLGLSGPLVKDKILFRMDGSYKRTDGQIRDITTGKLADFGRHQFLHGRLIFNLSDQLTLDLRGSYGHDHMGVLSAEVVSRADFDNYRPGFLASNPPLVDWRTLYDMSAKLEYKGSYLNISSVTGYSHVHDYLFGDGDFSPAHGVLQQVTLKVKALTEEIRITSPSEYRFRWLIGAFGQDRDTSNNLDVPFDDGTGNPVPDAYAIRSLDIGTSKSLAGFGSASYDLVPKKLELTVGGRYDLDKRTSVDQRFAGSQADHTFKSFQPKVQLAFKPVTDWNIYATYGKGFSSGGFNAYYSAAGNRQYQAETSDNFEAGVKASMANGRLTFSADVFRVYYHNQQFFFITASPPSQNITNIDKTRVDGGELEFHARPIDHLELSGGVGITDGKILAFSASPASIGNKMPQNTGYTLNFSGQYTIPLTDDLGLRAFASYRRQGAEYWDAANSLRTEPKDFINLRLFLEANAWSLGGFVTNLTNSQYPNNGAADAVGPDQNLRIPSQRRTYGVEASYRF